jgi:pyruvate dehydrogenase E1 component alpha subunit
MSDSALPPRDVALAWLRDMVRIRRFEERAAELYGLGKIRGFLHLYVGEEAVAVGVTRELGVDDAVVSTYREHGHALVRGVSMCAVMAEMFGKVEGCSRGRGGSMHLFSAERRFYGGQAIVSGGLPLAVGLALADKLMTEPRVTTCFFGDGAVAEGEFHEAMNLAALWSLPVLFVCENNGYAMGTAVERALSMTEIHKKAAAYDVASTVVDGMDVHAVAEATRVARAFVAGTSKPYLLECRTYRFRAHSMFDPERYRLKSEVAAWQERDPIETWAARLEASGLAVRADRAAIEEQVAAEVEHAVAFAERGTLEPVRDLLRDVCTPEAPR